MNAPFRWETFLLGPDQEKIKVEKDAKVPNACIFTIEKEDHTLGNMLRCQLLKDPRVVFAGYKKPHPLEHCIILRLQTNGDCTPADALQIAITDLIAELSSLEEQFRERVDDAKKAIKDNE